MKKVLSAVTFVVAAVTSLTILGGCSENLKETGNSIVSSAKDYRKSEVGVESDVSSLSQVGGKAVDYLKDEIGLNNTSNKVIEGTWNTKNSEDGDWVWTFDGKNLCKLTSKQNSYRADGSYSVNESENTVDICLDTEDEVVTYTYQLSQTLSDTYLKLQSDENTYQLILKK